MKSSDNAPIPKILFHDSHLLVAYKPAGVVVPIEDRGEDSLEGQIKKYLQKTLQKETVFLKPIHRLDKPVEGLVVFARSSKALSRLNEAQRDQQIEKFYIAKVAGRLSKKGGLLVHQLIHGDYEAKVVKAGGKEAKLRYRVVVESSHETVISIQLLTGRYHQIRAQFSAYGHPVLGDHRYGSTRNYKKDQIALYHTKIILPHPTLKKKIRFQMRPNSMLERLS